MDKPVVELSDCILCGVCVEVCPEVFRNSQSGYIDVIELDRYPYDGVEEAIRNCPADCIAWEEDR